MGGSPWEAAIASFLLFSLGAVVPVIPYMFARGSEAVLLSIVFSTVALFAVGGAITLFTGRSVLFSGTRHVLFGLIAAALTFGIGRLVGISLQ
jgi:VIT1/CCC1 family predicted Fe2+/Mn2+ transporter